MRIDGDDQIILNSRFMLQLSAYLEKLGYDVDSKYLTTGQTLVVILNQRDLQRLSNFDTKRSD
ncbi:MAG: hypothetical protein FWG65_03775 [Turicibacter sp.]|nr:hypothetical protein [Turicibacter sp.]